MAVFVQFPELELSPQGRARSCGRGRVLLFRYLRFFSLDHSQLCTEPADKKIRAKLPSGRFLHALCRDILRLRSKWIFRVKVKDWGDRGGWRACG